MTIKKRFEYLKKDTIAFIAHMPASGNSMLLIFIYLFLSITSITSGIENVFGQWTGPIYKTTASILIYFIIVSVAKILAPVPHARLRGAPAVCVAKTTQKDKLPPEVIKNYAVHEASHLITFALFDSPPDILNVWIKTHSSYPNGSNHFEFNNPPSDKGYYEKLMYLYLAGGCAVKTLLGNETIGNRDDVIGWEKTAKLYLSSFDHLFQWYAQPDNKAEGAINADTLRTLKKNQLKIVENIIRRNEHLIFSIADELIQSEAHEIDTEQSLNYLSKVQHVEITG